MLTIIDPLGVSVQFAVQHGVFHSVSVFPVTVGWSDPHPAGIDLAATVIAVDVEVAPAHSLNGKGIPRLGFHVIPGAFNQFLEWEPIKLVCSRGVEF